VGFSRDGMRALVYVGHECGSLCGGGKYHLLVKKDGRWQVDEISGECLACGRHSSLVRTGRLRDRLGLDSVTEVGHRARLYFGGSIVM
jgi:hypothetical protein